MPGWPWFTMLKTLVASPRKVNRVVRATGSRARARGRRRGIRDHRACYEASCRPGRSGHDLVLDKGGGVEPTRRGRIGEVWVHADQWSAVVSIAVEVGVDVAVGNSKRQPTAQLDNRREGPAVKDVPQRRTAAPVIVDRPVHARARQTVETRTAEISGARVKMAQTIKRGDDLLISATVEAAMVNGAGRPRRFPADWIKLFRPGSQDEII